MIVNNLNVGWSWRTARPFKTDAPLVIDTDTVLSLAIPDQRLETVAGQDCKVLQGRSGLQPIELQPRRTFDPRKRFHTFSCGKFPGALVSIADDQ
jgi:hypothetical protein